MTVGGRGKRVRVVQRWSPNDRLPRVLGIDGVILVRWVDNGGILHGDGDDFASGTGEGKWSGHSHSLCHSHGGGWW